jgi:hypothetical protein
VAVLVCFALVLPHSDLYFGCDSDVELLEAIGQV